MNRLWVRLTLAFALVTLTAVLIAALLANYQVSNDFRQYTMHNQMMTSLIPALADYYAAHHSWQGVESLLDEVRGMGLGNGNGQGQRRGAPVLILADADRQVVASTSTTVPAVPLSRNETAAALPIEQNGQVVGYLLANQPQNQVGLNAAGEAFLARINRSLIQAGLIAGVLGILLGLVIARGVAAPLRRLAAAAQRIAAGQLDQRVTETGADEIVELAHAFNEMAAHLEQSEEVRRNMVADVAHELRTPLSVVQGNLRAILDDVYPLDKEEIASIYDETLTLNRLINDLRELAQAEAGQLGLHLAPTDLGELVGGMVDRFQELARSKNIALSLTAPDTLPPVLADADRVRQAVHNYLANALRHTPDGGQIRVTVEYPAGPGQSGVRVAVADTGPGIPPADLPQVFDRFWRADKSRSREQGGSGLGLAITRQLIQAQSGRVGVTSNPGQGSRFWLTLPVDTGN
jgi:two-component system OmpR family sensor kinase/two-component system sensor histidine kinase BaeS